ncbi:MAG: response regulator, partial [Candidatus Omnitrophota bacterium]|nr:response regulator [Candidatus Omnitrophota bacterium]
MPSEGLKLKEVVEMSSDKKQIYIVDDDESVRRALGFLMASYGFAVETFSCAEEFFNAVPNSAPGCLILDIHMPVMDGWEVLERINKSKCKRPVIVISANKNGGFREQALRSYA